MGGGRKDGKRRGEAAVPFEFVASTAVALEVNPTGYRKMAILREGRPLFKQEPRQIKGEQRKGDKRSASRVRVRWMNKKEKGALEKWERNS